jgi:RNA polymerase sigma-70 factor (ECF subfamily)
MVKSNTLIPTRGHDCLDGDPLLEIIRNHERAILKTCRRWLHDRQDVEDAAQETYLRLFRMSDGVRTNAAGLAYTCAVHVSIDINRRRRTRRQREAAVAVEASRRHIHQPRQAMIDQQAEHEVHAALQKLDPRLRDLIVQRYFLDRPQVELASEAGVSPSTMSRRLDRAIQHLRTHLRA